MKFRRMISLLLAVVMIVGMIPAAWAAPASVEAVRDNQIGGERSRLFSHDWKFKLTCEDASGVDFDDSQWRELDVPHDWKIEKEEAWKHY